MGTKVWYECWGGTWISKGGGILKYQKCAGKSRRDRSFDPELNEVVAGLAGGYPSTVSIKNLSIFRFGTKGFAVCGVCTEVSKYWFWVDTKVWH